MTQTQFEMNLEAPPNLKPEKRKETAIIIKELKECGEDFEWYPTTKEILVKIAYDIKSDHYHGCSILDIGAGNGQVFDIIYNLINKVDEYGQNSFSITKYAIEKSKVLIDNMPDDIFIIGSDFNRQTLIDKKVDVIFCNPPYKEYMQWTEKIIKEANCQTIYLIIPERWKNNKLILDVIEKRTGKRKGYKILGNFDFINSEYREARAKVDIVKISLTGGGYSRGQAKVDPFDLWFAENFKIKADEASYTSEYETKRTRAEDINKIVKGQNVIERLEELYIKDLENLMDNYKGIERLDAELLKELEININNVKEALKMKIKGLKSLYWKELFDNLGSITEKLTTFSRKTMLDTLNNNTYVDYSCENAYAVVIWAIKNANKYFDSQLITVYKNITRPEAVKNYKSNKRMVTDDWRFCRDNHSHYTLDYRIVVPVWNCFNDSSFGGYDYPNGLANSAHDAINNICIIGENLGFTVNERSRSFQWAPGQEKEVHCCYKNQSETFMRVKAYKNGNLHFKLNQQFMTAFNVEASRLNGWVKSPADLKKETDISEKDINSFYSSNIKLNGIKMLENKK